MISSLKQFIEEHPDLPEKISETGNKAAEKVEKKSSQWSEASGQPATEKEKKGGKK